MTLGQPEKYIAAVFSFMKQGAPLAANTPTTYLPLSGGSSLATELSLVIPQNGFLKNIFWDCQSNGLTSVASNFKIKIGAPHASPSAAPVLTDALTVPLVTPLGVGITNQSVAFSFPVSAGQRIAVLVQTAAGGTNISRLRVSFELEVTRQSPTWQLAADNTTVFYDGGNVGIGTPTPTELLDVNGNINIPINSFLKMGGLPVISQKGDRNFFVGENSGSSVTTGYLNTGFGKKTLFLNQQGNANTACGESALFNNTNNLNTAVGYSALIDNTTGAGNTAVGCESLIVNQTGNHNTAVGYATGMSHLTGNDNTYIGSKAGPWTNNGYNNSTAIGANAMVGADNSLVLGNINVNVGIGTIIPQSKLDVMGSIKITDGTEGVGKVLSSDINGKGTWVKLNDWSLNGNANTVGAFLGTTDANPLTIGTNNTPCMRIIPSGRIEFGNPVLNDASMEIYGVLNFDGNGGRWGMFSVPSVIPTASDLVIKDAAQNVERLRIDTNGNVGIGTTTPTEKIDVNGVVKMTRIKLAGGNSGDVITCDPAGYGRWTTPVAPGDLGNQNTGIGFETLFNNTTGRMNMADGYQALYGNIGGSGNTASGYQALYLNDANDNTAIGKDSLRNNLGGENAAVGSQSLKTNTLGAANTSLGYNSLFSNTVGNNNVAVGHNTLAFNTTGYSNTAVGSGANVTVNNLINTTAIGANARVSTSNSLVLGDFSVNVGIGTSAPTSKLQVVGLPVFADNATAAASLTVGAFYRNGDFVCVVH